MQAGGSSTCGEQNNYHMIWVVAKVRSLDGNIGVIWVHILEVL